MLIILLILLLVCCIYKKHYKNYRIIHPSIIIWALITVAIIIFRPDINRNTYITYSQEKLLPIPNELDSTEVFYVIYDEDKILYKTDKIYSVNNNDSIHIIRDYSHSPVVKKYYKQNSHLWYLLTFNKNPILVKTEFIIN